MAANPRQGVVRNGRVELTEPLDLPEGAQVIVLPITRSTREQRLTALQRLRTRSRVTVSPPLDALGSESLYEDTP